MFGQMMDYPLTLQPILERSRALFPESEIVTRLDDESLARTNYGEFHGRVLRLMNVLRGLGIRPGDRVGTFAWNSARHLELYFAIPCLGAVLHTINVRLRRDQLGYIVRHAGDRVLFVDHSLADDLASMTAELPEDLRYVVMADRPDATHAIDGALDYETLMAAAEEREDFPALDERQAAGLCYTSGTTGEPKGVLYSHRSHYLHSMGSGMVDSMAVSRAETVLPVVPMFHANAWGFPFAAVFTGAKLVLPGRHLTGPLLADLIRRERVSLAAGVPTAWSLVLQSLRREEVARDGLPWLRSLIVGGSAAPVSLIRAWAEEFDVEVTHAWGMTETSPVGCCSRLKPAVLALPEDERIQARSKQGTAVPGVEVRLEADDGSLAPWDGTSVGELCVRGPWVAGSYFGEDGPGESFTADGWFRTGDVATIDELGSIHITDRKKDLIKSRGEWISTVDMENHAMAHPAVAEAAVTGRPDALRDEVPVLWVVPAEGAPRPEPAELVAHLAEAFQRWQLPKLENVRFLGEIPKTSVGKFDKKVLRARPHGDSP